MLLLEVGPESVPVPGWSEPAVRGGSEARCATGRGVGAEVRPARVEVERGVADRVEVGAGRDEVGRWRVVVGAGRVLVGRGARGVDEGAAVGPPAGAGRASEWSAGVPWSSARMRSAPTTAGSAT